MLSMRKTFFGLVTIVTVGIVGILSVAPAFALDLKDKVGSRPGLLRQVFDKKGKAAIGTGTLKSKSGDTAPATLVVTKDGKDYTVNVDASTQLRRRFWGKATLAEFTVGDTLNVIGQWADDAHTTINAKLVRDASIQKRFGVFVGKVTSLSGSGWVMDTVHRGSQTVTVGSSTKFVNRRGEAVTQVDVALGHRVRVKGMWDNKLNTITEVTHVKDYSLPAR